MMPDQNARRLLGITSAKAKMWEYRVPEEYHNISITVDPATLFDVAIASLGDLAATINGENYFSQDQLSELRAELKFSSYFFDSYLRSRLNSTIDPFTSICASACFYLCDLPGSSLVLAKQMGDDYPDLHCLGLEGLLLWLLQNDLAPYQNTSHGLFGQYIGKISQDIATFFLEGAEQERLFEQTLYLRDIAYEKGTPRQLLFADVIGAVVRKRIENSAWNCLPRYSELSVELWRSALQKETFPKELWPAQRLLGEHGIFRGRSAVVQMPTSAGKTKATEVIIRSAFLADRTPLAVLVAPFRALCHEIKDSLVTAFENESVEISELSDVPQEDFTFDFSVLEQKKQVLVVTPEKLHYVLRHEPELAHQIGLVIYDEAHLFDDASRGVNYELLLSSIKTQLPENSQTVLVSAVIKNADQLADWLLEDEGAVVTGTGLSPTNRNVAYASWTTALGQLQFPVVKNVQDYGFFLPRVLKEHSLNEGRTIFPNKSKPNEIALYLGLNLAPNGGVAIFCGTKLTAALICRTAVKMFKQGLTLPSPVNSADQAEMQRLGFLVGENLGSNSEVKKSTELGILAHHASIPHGIRLAVEYALQKELANFVVCTSTLAQGVNLPIRYLIITNVYQGRERIKTRDFHNLIGRAGRAVKHTEGSIIFANPQIFDLRKDAYNHWRWQQSRELLDPANSEDCVSVIARILAPVRSDKGKRYITTQPLDIAGIYLDNPENISLLGDRISQQHNDFSADKVQQQLLEKVTAIRAIQSYLLAHTEEWENDLQGVDPLVEGTLAYALADDENKQHLKDLFHLLTENIEETVPIPSVRHVYGRTLLGLKECIHIASWVEGHLSILLEADNEEELFRLLWPIVKEHIRNRSFIRCNPPEVLDLVVIDWLSGFSYHQILQSHLTEARLGTGSRPRRFKIEHVVDLCENGFGYDGSLVLGAITEFITLYEETDDEHSDLKETLGHLQKRFKYGLPSETDVILFELGFSDRVIAQEIKNTLQLSGRNRQVVFSSLRRQQDVLFETIQQFPSYYSEKAKILLGF
jgi:hypothetical protein